SLPLDPEADDWDKQPARTAPNQGANPIGSPETTASLPLAPLPSHLDATEDPLASQLEAQSELMPPKETPPTIVSETTLDDFDEQIDASLNDLTEGGPDLATVPKSEVQGQENLAEPPPPGPAPTEVAPSEAVSGETPQASDLADEGALANQLPENAPDLVPPTKTEEVAKKKVELDIEGIFLEEDETKDDPSLTPLATEETTEPPAPEAEPQGAPVVTVKQTSKLKKMIIIGPALLVVLAILFFAFRFFISPPKSTGPVSPTQLVEIKGPPKVATPGEMLLNAFYINFPGRTEDIIIEMSVIIHYNDGPDQVFIENRITAIRDVIFRVTQGFGPSVVNDSGVQRALRQELLELSNAVLDTPRISYIQISRLRVLR
ncbi:MAG: flagellar basal body-associated FliL family protein, partial [Candidatus Adiutrix sp.]